MILMGMVKHSQSSQNSKFAMSLLFLKKEVGCEVDFLRVDKNQSFLQVDTVIIDPEFSKYSKQQVCNIFTVSQKKVRN